MAAPGSPPAQMRIVATAGHVDHGKSTLVRALTGIDPDRLAEEQARGLTIDLGFAATTLPTAGRVMFLDVPGHLRFIKNMLAGVSALDACLLVIDVGEGWRQQTEEHVRILEQFATERGLVVVAKADTVDEDRRRVVVAEITERAAGTFLAGSEPVVTDARSGRGLDELVERLDTMLVDAPRAPDRGGRGCGSTGASRPPGRARWSRARSPMACCPRATPSRWSPVTACARAASASSSPWDDGRRPWGPAAGWPSTWPTWSAAPSTAVTS